MLPNIRIGKLHCIRTLSKHSRRCENRIKMDLNKDGCWIDVSY